MVDDRITDGRRIAQLLASELTGFERGPLERVTVVDAVRDVEPTPEGARAYDVTAGDERIATVAITESSARIAFADERDTSLPDRDDGLRIEPGSEGPVVVIEEGAAVKRAVDVVVTALE